MDYAKNKSTVTGLRAASIGLLVASFNMSNSHKKGSGVREQPSDVQTI